MNKTKRIQRLETCLACPELFKPTYTCKECGCFVKVKSAFDAFTCPLGKWDQGKDESA